MQSKGKFFPPERFTTIINCSSDMILDTYHPNYKDILPQIAEKAFPEFTVRPKPVGMRPGFVLTNESNETYYIKIEPNIPELRLIGNFLYGIGIGANTQYITNEEKCIVISRGLESSKNLTERVLAVKATNHKSNLLESIFPIITDVYHNYKNAGDLLKGNTEQFKVFDFSINNNAIRKTFIGDSAKPTAEQIQEFLELVPIKVKLDANTNKFVSGEERKNNESFVPACISQVLETCMIDYLDEIGIKNPTNFLRTSETMNANAMLNKLKSETHTRYYTEYYKTIVYYFKSLKPIVAILEDALKEKYIKTGMEEIKNAGFPKEDTKAYKDIISKYNQPVRDELRKMTVGTDSIVDTNSTEQKINHKLQESPKAQSKTQTIKSTEATQTLNSALPKPSRLLTKRPNQYINKTSSVDKIYSHGFKIALPDSSLEPNSSRITLNQITTPSASSRTTKTKTKSTTSTTLPSRKE